MTQGPENTDRETLLQDNPSRRDQDNSDDNDDEEAFPPSYEEATSHFDDNNTSATSPTTAPQQQPVLSPPPLPQLQHSQQPSRHFQHNDDFHNEQLQQQQQQQQHSRQPTENRSTNNTIGLADSSAPLKPTHTPSAPPAAAPDSGDNNDSRGQDNSNAPPQLNAFGHPHIDPFHQHPRHQHPSSSAGSTSPFPPMPPSSTVPGFGGVSGPPNMFGGLPPGPFPFGHPPSMLPPGVVPGSGFPGLFQPPIPPVPPSMFGIPGQGGFHPPADFPGFPSLGRLPVHPGFSSSASPGSRSDGKGSFNFGGPSGGHTGSDSTAPSSSGSGFSFGQTEAATTGSPHGSSPSSGRGFPRPPAPPAPPAIPGLPSMPPMSPMPSMPSMPSAHSTSPPDVPELPELPDMPSLPTGSASIPSDIVPTSGAGAGAGQGAESLPPSFFMATATSESRPVPPSGIASLEGAPTCSDISMATYKRTDRGVETQDLLLDDPFQLYRFFVAHNDKPQMHVLITGSHVEKKSTEKRVGDGTISTVHSKVKVCDFKIDLDLTSYISPYGTIKTLPDPKTSNKLTLREVIEQHVTEENPFKEMHMKKKVSWDYEDLTRAIVHAIRSVNYRYKIEISYPTSNNRVIVHSASPLAQFMRSTWTKAFCGISLVGVVLYPLREYYKVVKDKNIQSEFHMTISTADFMRNSYWKIVDQVQFKNE